MRAREIVGVGAGAVAEGVAFAIPAPVRRSAGLYLSQAGDVVSRAFSDPRGGMSGLGDVVTGGEHVVQAAATVALTPEIAIPVLITAGALLVREVVGRRRAAKS